MGDLAKHRRWDEVEQRLNEEPDLVNVQPTGRWSALHQAAFTGDASAVSLLLKRSADCLVQASDGQTPLDVAPAGPARAKLEACARCRSGTGRQMQQNQTGAAEADTGERFCETLAVDAASLPDIPPEAIAEYKA